MKSRYFIVGILVLFVLAGFSGFVETSRATASAKEKGVMLMNRIGPSTSELYVANADGTNERKLLADSTYDYHASFSSDGKWIVFTSERNGDGQSDISAKGSNYVSILLVRVGR